MSYIACFNGFTFFVRCALRMCIRTYVRPNTCTCCSGSVGCGWHRWNTSVSAYQQWGELLWMVVGITAMQVALCDSQHVGHT